MSMRDVQQQPFGIPTSQSHTWTPLLRELASLDAFPDQVVSLYLDVCWDGEQQRQRARLQIKDQLRRLRSQLGSGESDPPLAHDLSQVERFVDERTHSKGEPNDRGVALFLSAARGFERLVRSTFRFSNLLIAGPTPALRPILSSLAASGRTLCVVCDSTHAKLYELSSDSVGTLGMVDGMVPRRHHAGGWSQLKLQHYRTEQIAHLHKEAAQMVLRFFEESGQRARVLLGGRPGAQAGLEAHLAQPVKKRLRRVSDVSGSDSDAEALLGFTRALESIERDEASMRVRRVEEMAGADGHGVLGIDQVIDAVNTGRAAELLLSESFCLGGWRCARCRVIGVGAESTCSACSGPTESLELGEALVHGAILQDAAVTILPSPSRLDLHAGLAAETRF